MFPHYFGSDFSAALPWVVMGFVAGVLFVSLTRWLSGGGKQVQATIQGLHDQLSSSRLTASRLESDIGFLNTALADAERRAASSSDMARQNALLAKSEADSRAKAERLTGELTRVRQELGTYSSNGSNFEAEVQRLKAENASLKSSWDNNAQQFNKMRNELAEAEMKLRDFDLIRLKLAEAEKTAAQAETFKSQLEKTRSQFVLTMGDFDRTRAELAALQDRMAKSAAATDPSGSPGDGADVAQLKAEIASLKQKSSEYDHVRLELKSAQDRARDYDRLSSEVENLRAECSTLKMAERHRAAAAEAAGNGGLDTSALKTELAKTKADLAAANASLAAKKASPGASGAGAVPTGQFNAVMTDLTATRNLSIVQARELKHLRSEVARLAESQSSSSGISYADAKMSGRYTDRPLVSKRSAGIRSRFRGWRNPGGVEGEIAMLRAKVEQQEEELRRLTKRED